MFTNTDYEKPFKAYPQDVTSPGPDQQRGVVRSQRSLPPKPTGGKRPPSQTENEKPTEVKPEKSTDQADAHLS